VVHLMVGPHGDPADRHFHGPLALTTTVCLELEWSKAQLRGVRCGGEEEMPWRWYMYTPAQACGCAARPGWAGHRERPVSPRLSGWNASLGFLSQAKK
jgi:hypothetical protein